MWRDFRNETQSGMPGMSAELPRWLLRLGGASWRLLAAGALLYFGFRTLAALHVVVIPLLLGLLVAALLEPVVALTAKVLPRGLAALAAILLALAILVGAFAFLGVRVVDQFREAGDFVNRGFDRLTSLVAKRQQDVGGEVVGWFKAHGSGVASEVATGAMAVFLIGSETLLTLAFSFFMLRDGPGLFANLSGRLDDPHRARVRRMAGSAWKTLGRYLRGVSLIALVNSLEKGLALWLLGVPLILPIMLLTFVGSFIPLAGPIIAGTVAGLVALADSGVTTALLVVGAAFLIQIIEGNVLQPFVLGKTMQLQPIVILAAVTCGAIVAGLAGAFFAVPALAATRSALAVRAERGESRN